MNRDMSFPKKQAAFILVLLAVVIFTRMVVDESGDGTLGVRALPRPIASEPVLITSAGQSTDSYVVKDIANRLKLDNYFIPLASNSQLKDMEAMILVVGYSQVGMGFNELTFEDEFLRVEDLLEKAEEKGLSVISLYLRGSQLFDNENQRLLELAAKYSDYVIMVNESLDRESVDAWIGDSQLTVVGNLDELSEPIVSAFR